MYIGLSGINVCKIHECIYSLLVYFEMDGFDLYGNGETNVKHFGVQVHNSLVLRILI